MTGHQTATDAALDALERLVEEHNGNKALDAVFVAIRAIRDEVRAKAPRETKQLTERDVEHLVDKYGPWAEAEIARAMNHTASNKAKDKVMYVDNWLRKEAEKHPSPNGISATAMFIQERGLPTPCGRCAHTRYTHTDDGCVRFGCDCPAFVEPVTTNDLLQARR